MKNRITELIKKHRLDIIVISAILILSLSALLIYNLTKVPGATAVVEIDGVRVAEYPLEINGTYSLNGGTNILVIENGVAYLNYSSCPDHTCERKGNIKYVGQTIVCLPNRVSVTIKGDSSDGVDF